MVPMIDPARHSEHEALVGAQDGEAAVAAVAGEPHQQGGQGNTEREAAGDLDVVGEQQHDRGDEQLAAGDAHQGGLDANADAGR
jgi:hypothetical protein